MAAGNRRKSRELALQVLFQGEFVDNMNIVERLRYFRETFVIDDDVYNYAQTLLTGIDTQKAEIDGLIAGASEHWSLQRMALVDLNILRIATFEMKLSSEVPARAALNEAIELAKQYSNTESSGFINGILNKLLGDTP